MGKVYWKERLVWSPGFFVSTVGLNEKQIIAYVKMASTSGFRSSEASIVLKSATGYARGYLYDSCGVIQVQSIHDEEEKESGV